ncbi:MAG: 4-hydroxybenzoate decarboxylase, partial [Proteobacteria bacterium]|nr:4-hydroxybenzoate decarboxylase [Pseudomonadota bacterium]
LLARFRPETDLYVLSNLSMDTLDYTGPEVNLGSKGVMLGVGDPWRTLPGARPTHLPPGVDRAAVYCPGCLLIGGARHAQDPELLQRAVGTLTEWPLVIAVDDPERVAASDVRFLWTVFTRFEPAADIVATRTRVHRHHLVYEGTVGIDARDKEGYAEELFVDDQTRLTVDRRWNEYFPAGGVEMGDADEGHLDELG